MKVQYLIILLLISHSIVYGQNTQDCERIMNKEISFVDIQENIEGFETDIHTLIACEFDSVDYQIFTGRGSNMAFIGMAIIELNERFSEGEKYTFGDLRDVLSEFKQKENYLHIREVIEAENVIFNKTAKVENWDVDKQLLIKMGLQDYQTDEVYKILMSNENELYTEILTIYKDTLNNREERKTLEKEKRDADLKNKNPELEELIEGLFTYTNYELGLRKAKEEGKPALLFFTGYACINAKMIENEILKNVEIQNYINSNFIFISLYVDERSLLPENEWYYSEILNREVKYAGQIYMELEKEKYNSDLQPLLIKLDTNGNETSRQFYTNNIDVFWSFLKGIEN